jgi:hypothetical protein
MMFVPDRQANRQRRLDAEYIKQVGATIVGSNALLVLLIAAVLLGVGLQAMGSARIYARWPASALGAALGGHAASELFGTVLTSTWEWDGLAVIPGVLGGVATGLLVDLVLRKHLPEAI